MATDKAIWQEISAYTDHDSEFQVRINNVVRYVGTAIVPPDEDEVTIKVNDIVKDYVKSSVPSFTGGGVRSFTLPTVELIIEGSVEESVRVIPDWSYDSAHNVLDMADPIDGIADPRCYVPYTFAASAGSTKRPSVKVVYGSTSASPSYSSVEAGTIAVDLSSYNDPKSVTFDNKITYKVESTCKRYALYYVNAYGGVDLYIPKGICTQTANYTRGEFVRLTANRLTRSNYQNEVVNAWSLGTGLMTEEQSLKMHHLIGSCDIRLHDLHTGEIMPVVIKDSQLTYKTIENNGRKFPTYTINVELAHTRERR